MTKFKKIFPISMIIAIFFLVGCSNTEVKNKNTSSDNIQTIKVDGSLNRSFSNLSELKKNAAIVVECEVLDTNTIVYCDVPFTISNVSVINSLKGDIKEPTIKIIETGGKYKLTGENPKEQKGAEVDYQFEGIPVMQKGEHLYLFLKPFIGPQVQNAYVPLGAVQGKFKIDKDNKAVQQAPDELKAKDYKSLNKDKFVDTVKSIN